MTVVLRGPRLTLGRALDNTVQIRDRTVSAHHIELIDEGDHYRLHDLGSTNGVLVDGQPVTDFHLSQTCKIALGGVQCEFSPDTPTLTSGDPSLELATRAECETLMRAKAELTEEVKTLREEVALLQSNHAAEPGAASVSQAEFDRVVKELTAIKERVAERDRQIERLMSSRAVLQRDRDNLQRAINEAESKPVRVVVAAAPTPVPPSAAAMPKPAVAAPASAPAVPVPVTATPKPAAAVPPPNAPSMPAPKAKPFFVPAATTPTAPPASQLPKPPVPLKPTAVGNAPTMPVAKSPTSPLKAFPAAGPKGTQRIKV